MQKNFSEKFQKAVTKHMAIPVIYGERDYGHRKPAVSRDRLSRKEEREMTIADDSAIIQLFGKRDQQAISQTQQKYGKLGSQIAAQILGTKEDAEECINDALLRLWNAIPPAQPQSLGGYFMITVRNLACSQREKMHAEKRGGGLTEAPLDELENCLQTEENPEMIADRIALKEALNGFLSTLNAETRTMFVLRYWGEMQIGDIAERTGVSRSKVKMTLLRTRNKLKEYLEEEDIL